MDWKETVYVAAFFCVCVCVEAWRELFRMIFVFFQLNFCWRSSPGSFGFFYAEIPLSCGFAPITSIYHYLFLFSLSHYKKKNHYILCLNFYGHFPAVAKMTKKGGGALKFPLQLCLCMLFLKVVFLAEKWACFNKRIHCWVAVEAVTCISFFFYWNLCHKCYCFEAAEMHPVSCERLPFLSYLNLGVLCNSSSTESHVLRFHLSGLLQIYMQVTEEDLL